MSPVCEKEEVDSITSVGNLVQCLVTLTTRKCFLMFRGNLTSFNVLSDTEVGLQCKYKDISAILIFQTFTPRLQQGLQRWIILIMHVILAFAFSH